jgi:hypothetical protein
LAEVPLNSRNNLLQKSEIAINASREKQDDKIEFYTEKIDVIKTIKTTDDDGEDVVLYKVQFDNGKTLEINSKFVN